MKGSRFLFIYLNIVVSREKEGREKEKERNIDVREKHQSVASHIHSNRGPNLQPRRVPWLGTEPATLWSTEQCPTHWATLVRAASRLLHTEKWEETGISQERPNRKALFLQGPDCVTSYSYFLTTFGCCIWKGWVQLEGIYFCLDIGCWKRLKINFASEECNL